MKAMLWVFILVLGAAGVAPAVTVSEFNLANSVSGWGNFAPITQGNNANVTDATLFWNNNQVNMGPTRGDGTNISPYVTWSSAQTVGTVRVWAEDFRGYFRQWLYHQLKVDTLVGPASGAGTEANWVTRYTSATGLNTGFVDCALGGDFVTYGVRVQAFKTTNDINVGDIAIFTSLKSGTTLTDARARPTSIATSGDWFSDQQRRSWLATNGAWHDGGWLSQPPVTNAGTNITLTLNYTAATNIGGFSVYWWAQPTYSSVPTNWELWADTGSGLAQLGTFSRSTAANGQMRLNYNYTFDQLLAGVTQLELRVREDQVVSTLGINMVEFEAFNSILVPEPASTLLLVVGGTALMLARRRRRG